MIKQLSRLLAVLVLAISTLVVISTPRVHAIQSDRIVYMLGGDTIASINPDGTDRKILGTGTLPIVSPDGTKIAFTDGTRTGFTDLYVMNIDGSNVIDLTNETVVQRITDPHVSWSPDSQKIIYSKIVTGGDTPGSGPQDIFAVNIDGSGETNLTNSADTYSSFVPVWSPSGNEIAFARVIDNVSNIYVMNADGSNVHQVVTNASWPKWSPNGSKLLFESTFGDDFGDTEVGVANADGSNVTRLTNNNDYDGNAVWARDGNHVAMISNCNCGDPSYIRSIKPDGTGSIVVYMVEDGDGFSTTVDWSPDSTQILFGEQGNINPGLFRVEATGGTPMLVHAETQTVDYPTWAGQPSSADTTPPTVSSFTLTRKTSTQTENFAVAATDTESGVATGEFYYGSDPGQGNGMAMTYDGSQLHGTLGTDMSVGTYQVYVRAVDNAGNWSDPVSAKLVVTQTGTSRVTASGSFTPSAANGDQLPSLDTASFKLAQYNQNVSFGNSGIVNGSSANFTYTYGSSVLCGLFSTLPQCHRLTFTTSGSAAITSLVFSGTNNSQATVAGTAQITVDGVATTNPFTITAVSSSRAGSGSNSYRINIYNAGSSITPQNLLYTASNTGTVTIN